MSEIDYSTLQKKYGGQYIARNSSEILFHTSTYDELDDLITKSKLDISQLIIEYIEPTNIVCVY